MDKKHNFSMVILPPSFNRAKAKNLLADSGLSSHARHLLLLVLDQAEDYTLCCSDLQKRGGWGDRLWKKIKDELKAEGVMQQGKERLADNSHSWSLTFDLTKMQGSRARDADSVQGSCDPRTVQGSPDAETRAGLNLFLRPQEPPPQVVVAESQKIQGQPKYPVDLGNGLVWPNCVPPDLQPACLKELKPLQLDQQQDLLDELAGQPAGSIRNPARWLRHMAGLAVCDNLHLELAKGVQDARKARQAHELRQAYLGVQLHKPARDADFRGDGGQSPGVKEMLARIRPARAKSNH